MRNDKITHIGNVNRSYVLKKYLNLTNYCANGPPWIYIWTREKIAQLEPQTKSVLFNKEKAF